MTIEIRGLAPLPQVFDMSASIRFYRDVPGFTLVQTSPQLSDHPDDVNWAKLQACDATVMLNTAYELEYRPSGPEPRRYWAFLRMSGR